MRNYAFANLTALQSVEFPSTIAAISQYAFYGCSGLGRITIPTTILTASYQSFASCTSLSSVIVEGKTNFIGNGPFSGDTGLKKFVCLSDTPFTVPATFPVSGCSYYVPYSVINSYKTATNWASFANSIFPLVSTTEDLINIDTSAYTKACVTGSDESYKEYTYDGNQWNEVI